MTLSSAVTSGNLIVVAISSWRDGTAQISSITDNKGNTYYRALDALDPRNVNHILSIWYAPNVIGGTSFTITTNAPTGAIQAITVAAHEYRGMRTSSVLDTTHSNYGTSVSATSGLTMFTSQTNELVFGASLHEEDANPSITAGTNYAIKQKMTNGLYNEPLISEDRIVVLTGQYEATFTWSSSVRWINAVAVFKGL